MTDSSREPGATGDQATGPKNSAPLEPSHQPNTFQLPVVTTPLSRRELRQREAASEALPVVESRRQRRERELAKAVAASSVVSSSAGSGSVAAVSAAPASAVPASAAPASAAPVSAVPAAPASAAPASTPTQRTVSKSLFAQQIADMAAKAKPAVEAAAEPDASSPAVASPEPLALSAVASPERIVVSSQWEPFIPATDISEPVPAHLLAEEPASDVYDESDARNNAFSTAAVGDGAFGSDAYNDEPITDQLTIVSAQAEPQPVDDALQAQADASVLNEAPVVTSVSSLSFERTPDLAAPRAASSSIAAPGKRRVLPRRRRVSSRAASTHPQARKRTIVNTVVMVATAALVATVALPAYAYSDLGAFASTNSTASSEMGIQSLTVGNTGTIQDAPRDGYTSTGDIASMDSTTGTTVSPTVQALAAELMADVASGKLVGSVPNHLTEIQNLANGVVVPNCGVDYRVLQAIKVAVDNFSKVGISDINRKCTGQIEGAGTASAHYTDGGGHAVDFYILNGHGLTGADADSLKLIALLDPLVPPGSGLGQAECRGSTSVTNFAPFDDTCTHDHIDFLNAKGVALKSS